MRKETFWISDDGRQFKDEQSCLEYESKAAPIRSLASCNLMKGWDNAAIEGLLGYIKERPSIFIPYLLPELKEELNGYKSYIESTGDETHCGLDNLINKLKK